jgi:hypothetical protein
MSVDTIAAISFALIWVALAAVFIRHADRTSIRPARAAPCTVVLAADSFVRERAAR